MFTSPLSIEKRNPFCEHNPTVCDSVYSSCLANGLQWQLLFRDRHPLFSSDKGRFRFLEAKTEPLVFTFIKIFHKIFADFTVCSIEMLWTRVWYAVAKSNLRDFYVEETKETLKSTSDSSSTVTKQLKSHKITRSKKQICSKHLLDAELWYRGLELFSVFLLFFNWFSDVQLWICDRHRRENCRLLKRSSGNSQLLNYNTPRSTSLI